jgi:hypothetical protein
MAMYTSKDAVQRNQINAFMTAFQEHPQAWTRVDTILEATKCDQSKFFVRAPQLQCHMPCTTCVSQACRMCATASVDMRCARVCCVDGCDEPRHGSHACDRRRR